MSATQELMEWSHFDYFIVVRFMVGNFRLVSYQILVFAWLYKVDVGKYLLAPNVWCIDPLSITVWLVVEQSFFNVIMTITAWRVVFVYHLPSEEGA